MLLFSLPLSTTPCPTFSRYFLSLYAICLHFSILLLSFPLLTIFPAVFYAVFPLFLMLLLSLPLPSPHVLNFLQIFARCTSVSLHFPILLLSFPSPTILLLSFPLPTITSTTFSELSIASSATKMADLGGIEPHRQPIA